MADETSNRKHPERNDGQDRPKSSSRRRRRKPRPPQTQGTQGEAAVQQRRPEKGDQRKPKPRVQAVRDDGPRMQEVQAPDTNREEERAPRPRKSRQKRWNREETPVIETYEDIVRDNARLEREIGLDIESLRQMHFDLG